MTNGAQHYAGWTDFHWMGTVLWATCPDGSPAPVGEYDVDTLLLFDEVGDTIWSSPEIEQGRAMDVARMRVIAYGGTWRQEGAAASPDLVETVGDLAAMASDLAFWVEADQEQQKIEAVDIEDGDIEDGDTFNVDDPPPARKFEPGPLGQHAEVLSKRERLAADYVYQPGDGTRYEFTIVNNRNGYLFTWTNRSRGGLAMIVPPGKEPVHPGYVAEKTGLERYEATVIARFLTDHLPDFAGFRR